MDKQIYKDRILETENLTDELDDSSASWLLDWGVNQLDRVLEGASEATAGERVNALMAVMRKINRMVGKLSSGDYSKSRLAEDLAALHNLFAVAFPSPAPAADGKASLEESSSPEEPSSEEEHPSFSSFLDSLFGRKPSSAEHPAKPKTPPASEKAANPETPPARVDYAAAAAHLLELEPRPALEYLAGGFYRP